LYICYIFLVIMALSFCTPSTTTAVGQKTNDNRIDVSTTALDFVSALVTTKFNIFTSGELRLDDITFRVAGRGGHASIEIGVATLPRKHLVAVKRSLLQSDQWFNGPSDSKKILGRAFEQIVRELRVLGHGSIRKHKNLVNVEGICMDDFNSVPSLAIVMEYSKFGTLRQFLVENKDKISLDERMSFVMQSCRGLDALHQVKVCHADIKIDNALVFKSSTGPTDTETWIIKISDLGQSVIASRDNPDGRVPCRSGTRLLEAPEIRRGDAFFDTGYNIHAALRTDIFSFGLYIWEVVNNGEQYFDTNWIHQPGGQIDIDTMENFLNELPEDGLLSYATIFAKGFRRQGISEQLLLLLRGTLPDDPHARKTMSELMTLFVDSEESDESDAASGSSDDVEAILAQLDMKNDQFSPSSIVSWGTRNSFYDVSD
jgi:serine/threonine protein kinase